MARRIINKATHGPEPHFVGAGLWFRIRNARALTRALHGETRHI